MNFVIKGDVAYSRSKEELFLAENAYVVCENGVCAGVFNTLPERYRSFPLKDCSGCLIIPGMTDLHLHAPQFAFRGLGMDRELLDWLEAYAFKEEAKYSDLAYAENDFKKFGLLGHARVLKGVKDEEEDF